MAKNSMDAPVLLPLIFGNGVNPTVIITFDVSPVKPPQRIRRHPVIHNILGNATVVIISAVQVDYQVTVWQVVIYFPHQRRWPEVVRLEVPIADIDHAAVLNKDLLCEYRVAQEGNAENP